MRIAIRLITVAILVSAIAACGDKFDNAPAASTAGSTSTATSTTGSTSTANTKVTLSGSVSGMAAKPSSKPANGGDGQFHSPMAGGEIKVIDSAGNVIATTTINADGTYKVNIDAGSNYVVKATKGNVCLKAFVETVQTDKSVTVDPTSSAIVKVLAVKIGNDNLGDEGVDVSNITSSSNISAIITEISVSTVINQIAVAIQNDIAANADYSATTVTVGAASNAGNNEANSVALNITVTITITNNGQVVAAPATPANVSLAAGNGKVTISWDAVAGATSYNVYYSTMAGVAGTKIGGITTGTSYNLAGLANGTTYYFVVTASKSGLESNGSAQLGATPQVPVAGAPASAAVTPGNGQALLRWTAVSDATSYNIYYKSSSDVTTANGTKISGITATSYTITGLANGTTYYFIVTAINAGGESKSSAQTSATPQLPVTDAPAGVSTTSGNGQVLLSWTAVTGATSYNVYWKSSSDVTTGNGTKISGITATSYTITGLANGTTYYFIVTAINPGGESAISSKVSSTPQVPAPTAPAGVTATSGSGQALVNWTAVTGATSYRIYWKTSSDVTTANGTKISGITATSYTVTGLANGTTYYFIVTAINAGGESAISSMVSATPQLSAPSAPTGVIAIAGDSTVSLYWNAISGATYSIYRSTSSGAQGSLLGTSSTANYTDSTTVNGTTYYYTITAANAGGQSSGSGQVSATPLAPTPATSTGAGYDEILYDADTYE